MNFTIALLLTLFVSQAFALVGDSSIFQGTFSSSCESAPKKLQTSYEIVAEAADGFENPRTEIKKTRWLAEEVSETIFIYNQKINGRPFGDKKFLRDYCQREKGTIETIQVLGKDTLACRVSSVDELDFTLTTWIGYSPIGVLGWKAERENPRTSCIEMIEQSATAFRFANEN